MKPSWTTKVRRFCKKHRANLWINYDYTTKKWWCQIANDKREIQSYALEPTHIQAIDVAIKKWGRQAWVKK